MRKTGLLLLLMFQIGLSAISLDVKNYEVSGDNKWMRPNIKITNTGTTSLSVSNLVVNYYIYESNLTLAQIADTIWCFSKNGGSCIANTGVLSNTSFSPAYVAGAGKCNYKIQVTFPSSTLTLAQNEYIEISIGIHASTWVDITKTDDYSYNGATSYQTNNNIVVSNSGTVVFGTAPNSGLTRLAMNWIGAYPVAPTSPSAGDVYFNTTDNNAYVYTSSVWNLLSNEFWQKDASGIYYKTANVTAKKVVSDSLIVKNVVVTPKWQISNTPPDYVFDKDYKLPTLSEVEKYIDENSHLNGIPSAEELKRNGVDLADMNMKLLKKIEELTLYTIQLSRQVKNVSDSLNAMNQRNK